MQRPLSMLSDHSVASSSAGPSSGPGSQRQRPRLTGPRTRKPTNKSTLSNVSESTPLRHTHALPPLPTTASVQAVDESTLSPAAQPEEQRHDQNDFYDRGDREEVRNRDSVQSKRPQSEQLPSYVQSQQSQHEAMPPRPFSPSPPSASDSSCSFPPHRTSSPQPESEASSVPALTMPSPVRTQSTPPLSLHREDSTRRRRMHDSPRQISSTLTPDNISTAGLSSESSSVLLVSKPSTPTQRPETPASIKSRSCAMSTPLSHIPQPAPIDFSSVPITWKALTLDAAQWSFSSSELQAIVSRAIRASAEPSSIRLLPIQTIDQELGEETQRLEYERVQLQAKYRFSVQRRTNLLQSLNAVSYGTGSGPSTSPSVSNFSQVGTNASSGNPASELVHRLAEISESLDSISQNLLRISDQLAQIRALQDVHAASALAVALRKLNASYARRTKDIQTLKERLETAEEERDEAWRVAEELAMEADADIDDDLGEILEGDVVSAEKAVAASATLTRASKVGVGIKIKTPGVGPRIRTAAVSVDQSNQRDKTADASLDAAEMFSPGSVPEESRLSQASIPRRRRANSATSRVSAARTRSMRASKASLRLPRGRNMDRNGGNDTAPPSAYSRGSSRAASRQRSRSRPGSFSGPSSSPLDANVFSPAYSSGATAGGGKEIPDVPKIPGAAELERLETVKAAEMAKMLSPMTAGTLEGSFLDMVTRPSPSVEEKPADELQINGTSANNDASDEMTNGLTSTSGELRLCLLRHYPSYFIDESIH